MNAHASSKKWFVKTSMKAGPNAPASRLPRSARAVFIGVLAMMLASCAPAWRPEPGQREALIIVNLDPLPVHHIAGDYGITWSYVMTNFGDNNWNLPVQFGLALQLELESRTDWKAEIAAVPEALPPSLEGISRSSGFTFQLLDPYPELFRVIAQESETDLILLVTAMESRRDNKAGYGMKSYCPNGTFCRNAAINGLTVVLIDGRSGELIERLWWNNPEQRIEPYISENVAQHRLTPDQVLQLKAALKHNFLQLARTTVDRLEKLGEGK